jgi:3-phosphoshikimate 1-carboxyvinyltransferase
MIPAPRDVPWQAPLAGGPVTGSVSLPGSKSQTNRALLIAALSRTPSTVHAPLRARDTDLMAAALRGLGARIDDTPEGGWHVTPGPLPTDPVEIECGLAGTVARFLPPFAARGTGPVRFVGDPRMSQRPLGPLLSALRVLGATVEGEAVPMTVHGPTHGGRVTVDASTSSQLVSGLLLSAPALPAGLDLRHNGPRVPSSHHLAMTVRMLREAGGRIDVSPDHWQVAAGPLDAVDRMIEPDLSSASAFLAAAAATAGSVTIPGWPADTDQPGAVLPDLLVSMGCSVRRSANDLTIDGPAVLDGFTVDLRDVPELALTLAALATLARTPSRLTGIGHLRLQESDRLGAFATELGRLGARIDILDEGGLAIHPARLDAGPGGVVLDPHADHRLAMAYAVVGLVVPGVRISDIATTGKTVPGFENVWERLVRQ